MATEKRLLELALKGLEAERTRIDQEMAAIRSQLSGTNAPAARRKKTRRKKATRKKATGRRMSAARRKALSESMKKAWARRKRGQK